MQEGVIFEREPAKKPETDSVVKLDQVTKSAREILFETKTVFPFDFFPDRVVVDKNKVDLVVSRFFFSQEIYSIPISSINAISVTTSLFFATLIVEITGFESNPPHINFLWKKEAIRAQQIINGLILSNREGVKFTEVGKDLLTGRAERIGKAVENKSRL